MKTTAALGILVLVAAAGCQSYVTAPAPRHPTSRTFLAPRDEVWRACLSALDEATLASVDGGSGIAITDWTVGVSDHRFVRRLGGLEPLPVRRKLVVRLQDAGRGARVSVTNVEYTAYREHRRVPLDAAHRPWSRGFPGTRFPPRDSAYLSYDRFVRTPSSTRREKDFLDRVERILRQRLER